MKEIKEMTSKELFELAELKLQEERVKEEEGEFQLYVWEDFCPDYTSGIAFAIATSEAKAREYVMDYHGKIYDWGVLSIHPVNHPIAYAISGGS